MELPIANGLVVCLVLKTRVSYFWRRRKSRAGGDYAAAAAFFWPMTYQKVTAAAMTSRGMAPIFTQFQPKKCHNSDHQIHYL
ncbi:MAG: hypothetical protein EBT18_12600 [Gammaproteobacteria bacterium]|nr:hypothetical protein [Gammaproteobacteria bacterium]